MGIFSKKNFKPNNRQTYSKRDILLNHLIKNEQKANKLRSAFKVSCKSPKINNIYSEIFIKSLNALAFNMIALYFRQNNKSLKKNKKAIKMVEKIMLEGRSYETIKDKASSKL